MIEKINNYTAIMENRKAKKKKNNNIADTNNKIRSSKSSSGAKDKGEAPTPPLLEGMSTAEVRMIRRLAGNDPQARKKTIRKLRKWLSTIVLRFPQGTMDCRAEVEPNLVRVWKALFYCMWMADKPLPQEQLAEQISDLVHIFTIKPTVFLVFVEWFFRTLAREWNWIDRFRLDKFMMLYRRFVRKTLVAISSEKWDKEFVDGFLRIVRIYIFNHQPTTKFKKGTTDTSSAEPVVNCPVGLQIHFIDIFLEELAKAGKDGLKPGKVMKLLGPFIEEMATNDDRRVLDQIKERIFHHLMRQSDVGIDYQESLMVGSGQIEDEDSDDLDEQEGNSDNNAEEGEENETMGEDDVFEADPGPLDPRAGAVDVILPQLPLDYTILVDKLTEAGGSKTVKKHNRSRLYALAKSFKDLVEGKYPLALPEDEPWRPAIPRKEMSKATERYLEEEAAELEGSRRRKTKKQRRRDARRLQQQEQLDETVGSEDTSAYLNDDDMFDNLTEKYSDYVDEQMPETPPPKQDTDMVDSSTDTPSSKKRKTKKQKAINGSSPTMLANSQEHNDEEISKKKYKTVIEFEADEANQEFTVSIDNAKQVNVPVQKKKKRKSLTFVTSEEEKPPKIKRRETKSLSPNSNLGSLSSVLNSNKKSKGKKEDSLSPPQLTPISSVLRHSVLKRNLGFSGTPNSDGSKRRINFVLAKNLEHEATDYMPSISRSPAIPFDSNKTPTTGILKVKDGFSSFNSTPQRKTFGVKTSPRKKALDFF